MKEDELFLVFAGLALLFGLLNAVITTTGLLSAIMLLAFTASFGFAVYFYLRSV